MAPEDEQKMCPTDLTKGKHFIGYPILDQQILPQVYGSSGFCLNEAWCNHRLVLHK